MNKIVVITTLLLLQLSLASATIATEKKTKMRPQELTSKQLTAQNKEIVSLAAIEMNKTLPQKVDKYTVLNRIESEGTVLKYIFEINTGAKSDETVQKEDRRHMKKAVIDGICRSYKRFLDAQITVSYIYRSASSKADLFRFDIAQKDCNY